MQNTCFNGKLGRHLSLLFQQILTVELVWLVVLGLLVRPMVESACLNALALRFVQSDNTLPMICELSVLLE